MNLHTRPIIENPKALRIPITAINPRAGSTADGEFPKAAIPAGKDNTPDPMIPLTKLKISLDIEADPPRLVAFLLVAPPLLLRSLSPETKNSLNVNDLVAGDATKDFAFTGSWLSNPNKSQNTEVFFIATEDYLPT